MKPTMSRSLEMSLGKRTSPMSLRYISTLAAAVGPHMVALRMPREFWV